MPKYQGVTYQNIKALHAAKYEGVKCQNIKKIHGKI